MNQRLIALVLALAATLTVPVTAGAAPAAETSQPRSSEARVRVDPPDADMVLVISIDGLASRALTKLSPGDIPHLHAFRAAGTSTLNARTQYELTLTLPNHTGMVTGRRVLAAKGGHGVTWNDDRRRPRTVQAAARESVGSVFSRVAGAGGSSALFANKTKFSLWKRSWPDGIDHSVITTNTSHLVSRVIADLDTHRDFRFVHIALPDTAGHGHGFMSGPYLKAVRRSDRILGRIMEAVHANDHLRDRTAIILTSDHGGIAGSTRHDDPTALPNYRIPFMVVGPGIPAGTDLYALNPAYRDPRGRRVGYAARRQPIRNTMVANLALDLLDLGSIPGSQANLMQDLEVD